MFGTDIMIELRMFGFTNIPELVSPPPPSILKTPEGCKDKSCVFVFPYFLDSILICLPNFWGSYQVGLLSLGPEGEGTNSKTCVQFNILDFGAKHKYSQ